MSESSVAPFGHVQFCRQPGLLLCAFQIIHRCRQFLIVAPANEPSPSGHDSISAFHVPELRVNRVNGFSVASITPIRFALSALISSSCSLISVMSGEPDHAELVSFVIYMPATFTVSLCFDLKLPFSWFFRDSSTTGPVRRTCCLSSTLPQLWKKSPVSFTKQFASGSVQTSRTHH